MEAARGTSYRSLAYAVSFNPGNLAAARRCGQSFPEGAHIIRAWIVTPFSTINTATRGAEVNIRLLPKIYVDLFASLHPINMRSATSSGNSVGKAITGCASAVGRGVTSCFSSSKSKPKARDGKSQHAWDNQTQSPLMDKGTAFGEGALQYNPFNEEVRSPRASNPWKQSAPAHRANKGAPRAKAFGEGALQQWH